MDWLNYHHLYYFWSVAKLGSITAASKELRLSPSTISEQLRVLESSLAQPLFERSHRRLVLTDVGQVVLRYAEQIFSTGSELQAYLQGRPTLGARRLEVGVEDVIPKLVAAQLLSIALEQEPPVHLICHEGARPQLMERLTLHQLDLVLSDTAAPADSATRLSSHHLGDSPVCLFGSPALAERYALSAPRSLQGAPLLVPLANSAARRALDDWWRCRDIAPLIIAEVEDSALLKTFGARGLGLFCAPALIRDEVMRHYEVRCLGQLDGVISSFYAISAARQIEHPCVLAVIEGARAELDAARAP